MSPDAPPPSSANTRGRDYRVGGRPVGDTSKGTTTAEEVTALIAAIVNGGHRYEYRVRYQRQGWSGASTKVFQYEKSAHRYSWKLRGGDGRYAPLILLVIERRPVGPWNHFLTLVDTDAGVDIRKEGRS